MKKFWNDSFYINSFISNDQSITGTLNPINWDRFGKIKQFSIYSEDEEDIIVVSYSNKRKLEKLLNKRVLAKGQVKIDENGDKYIRLKSIKELTGPTSPAINLAKPIESTFWNDEYSLSIPKDYAIAQYNQIGDTYLWEAS
jgi:transcription termination factor Rho